MKDLFKKTIEIYIFNSDVAHVYIRKYCDGDRRKFMVRNGVQFYRDVVLCNRYDCITQLTSGIQNVMIFE